MCKNEAIFHSVPTITKFTFRDGREAIKGYAFIRCRDKSEECISVIYAVYMESGKKLLGYDREIAYFSKTAAKERNTAQRFLCPLCRICDVSVMER